MDFAFVDRGVCLDNGSYPDTLSPMHTEPSTLTEIDSRSGKRRRHDSNDSNGSDNEVMEEVQLRLRMLE